MYFFTCQSFKSWQITRFAKVKNIKLLNMLQTAILRDLGSSIVFLSPLTLQIIIHMVTYIDIYFSPI